MRVQRILWFGLSLGMCVATGRAVGQEAARVESCPGNRNTPVVFLADCSHVTDGTAKQLCGAFLENQACKVFPAYRTLTGIHLEEKCPTMKYTIYEKENWPYPNLKGEGGLAGKCEITLMSDYSLKVKSKIGPYDLHELLHEYQMVAGPFSTEHPFFDVTQTEAAKQIGDAEGAEAYLRKVKNEISAGDQALQKASGGLKECTMAQLVVVNQLYLEDPRIVGAIYRKLGPLPERKALEALQVRENRTIYIVSNEKAKPFLMEHGCAKF